MDVQVIFITKIVKLIVNLCSARPICSMIIEFEKSLNVFTEFNDKSICHFSERVWTCHLFCYRPRCYHRASLTHVRDRYFKLTPMHASAIYQIPWIHWIHWISVPFLENSIVSDHGWKIPFYFNAICLKSMVESFSRTTFQNAQQSNSNKRTKYLWV